MKLSYKWLQTYFKETLPSAEKLEEVITLGAFEIENIKEVGEDYILDIDVLPNRAHDCLSHRGIAKELAVLLETSTKPAKDGPLQTCKGRSFAGLVVEVEEQDLCRRYIGRRIEGVKVESSPDWLKERIETIGQKSINNIVDVTNYVMFDVGQPLHAFDADKVDGGIVIRYAKKGEKIITLSGDEVELDESMLVIADEKCPLAIAGVKGGKKAEVDESTTNIILESANFAPVNIRRTSRKLGIRTDSSKRFENEITPEMAELGMEEATALVVEVAGSGNTKVGNAIDIYPRKVNPYKVGVSLDEINNLLGVQLPKKEVGDIWSKFGFKVETVIPRQKVLDTVASVIESKYKRPSAMQYDAPHAFSCTSLISYLFVQAGIYMPSMAVDKYMFGNIVSREELKPGDVIFVNTGEGTDGKAPKIYHETIEWMPGTKVSEGVDHAGVYLGGGKVLHTSWTFGKAVIEELDSSKQFQNIVGYRSFIKDEKERYVVTIPSERLDLRIKEDLIEEIARVYGYSNIKPELLEKTEDVPVNKTFYYVNKIRSILVREGFSEVYTGTFVGGGSVEVENPIASDKGFLRSNLREKVVEAINNNLKYADLLEIDKVKVFEIGKVFNTNKENMSLCISVGISKLKKGDNPDKYIEDILEHISKELGIKISAEKGNPYAEIDFDKLIEELPKPTSYDDVLETYIGDVKYQKISPYPFIGRDIAVWVPEGVAEEDIKEVIRSEAGELLVRGPKLFDRFEKKNKETGEIEKVSYAFKMVFQSQERTLTDEEVNETMNKITKILNNKEGWEVR
ncbi:MAG TPA: hypothetical protein ENI66_01300 [Candidatus Yonathbacteria bacterium]|nr:hypothetical protein [Candidatus Yonathbacteria bacterium]